MVIYELELNLDNKQCTNQVDVAIKNINNNNNNNNRKCEDTVYETHDISIKNENIGTIPYAFSIETTMTLNYK